MRRMALFAALLLTSGCASWPQDRLTSCPTSLNDPAITRAKDGRMGTTLSVLIYNVEGLPWPARKKRGPWLDRIGTELARLRAAGVAPDIVLMQEAFMPRAARIGERAGYANVFRGPTKRELSRENTASKEFIAARRFKKGEKTKVLGSGLYVLSDFPVTEVYRQGFSRTSCAGFDCLAAKGVMLVRVAVPGVPAPVDVFTTHMNAGGAARVGMERTIEAHRYQAIEAAQFLDKARAPDNPLIVGGDFNMRRSPERFDFFTTANPYEIVHRWCLKRPAACDIRMSWDGDEPWLDTQDLQAFDNGRLVRVEPMRVEALFDGPQSGGKLSDHDGFLVTYRLSWPANAPAANVSCPYLKTP